MSEQKDKTPEQVTDEDYKVAPTSADKERLNKQRAPTDKKDKRRARTSNRRKLSADSHRKTNVKEELRKG